jgi:hypothetical protein
MDILPYDGLVRLEKSRSLMFLKMLTLMHVREFATAMIKHLKGFRYIYCV